MTDRQHQIEKTRRQLSLMEDVARVYNRVSGKTSDRSDIEYFEQKLAALLAEEEAS